MDISSEMVAILGVGVALAGLMLAGQQRTDKRMDQLRADMSDMRSELSARLDGLDGRIDGLDERLRAVEAGLAELRGQLGFVRDYILRRNAPPDEPPPAPAE